MLSNRNCIWRLNCVEMVVDDTFRERVLEGCVPRTVAVGDNPFGLCKVPATFERLINSVLGNKRSQISVMAWLHTLKVTLKFYFNTRCRRRCHKRYIWEARVRLKDQFDENWRPVEESTASVSRPTAVSDYFLSHDFSSTHIDLIPWELVHIKLKKHISDYGGGIKLAPKGTHKRYTLFHPQTFVLMGRYNPLLAVEGLGHTWSIFADLLQHFSSRYHHIISLCARRRGGCVCRSTWSWFNLQKLECGGSYSSLVLGRREKPNFV